MNEKYPRRQFIKTVPVAAWAMSRAVEGFAMNAPVSTGGPKLKLETFEYDGVTLTASRWKKQQEAARAFWMKLSEDDTLHGFRVDAKLDAPGKALGGWAARNTGGIFGQWLSGMARLAKGTGDTELRDKAVRLFTEWSKTVGADGNCHMRHYAFEKLACGLVDLQLYANCPEAGAMLEKVTDWAMKNFDHSNHPAGRVTSPSGSPGEWYTLAENFYRAYQMTGNANFKAFADLWLYHNYWDKFAKTAAPAEAYGYHAYSHVNTFSSAAMAYAVTGDAQYLQIIKNAYDWLQNTQCYVTGGYGPSETTVAGKGGLGQVLEVRSDTFETACGSWAAFKLGRYLMSFTGESRYGDWIERILYNGIGAALPISSDGHTFYYSDYRVAGGMKVYYWDAWPCCAGSYIQAVADYQNLIYLKDANSLYVNLFVPSEVTWKCPGVGLDNNPNKNAKAPTVEVKLTQTTGYPETETSTLKLETTNVTRFPLRIRVPEWAHGMSLKVNGTAADAACKPGTWAVLDRAWNSGDEVQVHIPLPMQMKAVDREHPDRVAVARGPVAMVMEGGWQEIDFKLPKTDADFQKMLVPDERNAGMFQVKSPKSGFNHSKFRPFYTVGERTAYYMYFDKKSLPVVMW